MPNLEEIGKLRGMNFPHPGAMPTPEEARDIIWRAGEMPPAEDVAYSLRAIFDATAQGAEAQERAAEALESIAGEVRALAAALRPLVAQFAGDAS